MAVAYRGWNGIAAPGFKRCLPRVACCLLVTSQSGSFAPAQVQIIDFPHNKHVAMGLECIDCHSHADTRADAAIPSIRKCLLCHEKLANEGPGVTRLLEFAKQGREVPWRRVYGFEKSAHVIFRHAPHVRAGIACETCHGNVSAMSTAQKAVNHTMGTCLACHRQNHASEDCIDCHY